MGSVCVCICLVEDGGCWPRFGGLGLLRLCLCLCRRGRWHCCYCWGLQLESLEMGLQICSSLDSVHETKQDYRRAKWWADTTQNRVWKVESRRAFLLSKKKIFTIYSVPNAAKAWSNLAGKMWGTGRRSAGWQGCGPTPPARCRDLGLKMGLRVGPFPSQATRTARTPAAPGLG